MKLKAKSNNHKPGSAAVLPTEFVCIDEDEAVAVFDYLNGADDNVDKELIAVHLQLCFDCQEAVVALLALNPAARQRLAVLKPQRVPTMV